MLLEKPGHLCTPFALIRKEILLKNLQTYAKLFTQRKISLRPHIKTHKCAEIALMQIQLGSAGITVATVYEAEFMLESGIKNIFIARPVVGVADFTKLAKITAIGNLSFSIDSIFHLEEFERLASSLCQPVKILIEIDSGHNRCGIRADKLKNSAIIEFIRNRPDTFSLKGVYTHAGHVYSQSNLADIEKVSRQECDAVIEASSIIRDQGLSCPVVSVGTTPTANFVSNIEITEVRPGNYVFNDGIQVSNGTASIEQCALRIVSRVIGIYDDHIVIDAGSKALGLDRGAHGTTAVEGFGTIINFPELIISRLSEEHGIISIASPRVKLPAAGELLEIIPNHSCAAANLFCCYQVYSETSGHEIWAISGRR